MNDDQQLVSWLAVVGLIIAVMLVYRGQLSAILFGPSVTPGYADGPITVAPGTSGEGPGGGNIYHDYPTPVQPYGSQVPNTDTAGFLAPVGGVFI